jgi:hypothetical protein
MKFPSLAILTALLVSTGLVFASVAPQVELVSNLPANGSAVVVNTDAWLAESFTIPTTFTPFGGGAPVANQKLNFLGIEVALQRNGKPVTTQYAFRLFNNLPTPPALQPTPGTPSQVVGLFGMTKFQQPASLAAGAAASGTFLLNSYSVVTLTPGYTYWVVFSSTTPTSSANTLSWITSTNTPTGLPNGVMNTGTILQSTDQGATWTPFSGGAPAFKVHIVAL